MCGIVGTYHFGTDEPVNDQLLATMRDTMAHRGPDGVDLWLSPNQKIGLAHRRLAIIDLSTEADQPISNEDDTIWLIFNGEIYNHAEIRAELEAIGGHRWKTDHSDTEMLIHAYEQWGIDCLDKFRGMFAFALWDARDQSLWLVRDRIGIKPMYYTIRDGRISFASEIKALLADQRTPRVVNEEAFYHYLSFLTTPAPETLFEGICKLPGGTWMRIAADGTIREQRYWDAWDAVNPINGDEREIAEQVLEELRTAVQLRKVSDVPVGVFLSGGIDSSTNTALFSEGEDGPVKTFSIGYDDDYRSYRNELDYARLMADQVGAAYHERLLSQDDLVTFLPRMVQLQDEPIADPVCVPLFYVSELARQSGVTVCQVGEGADELFFGYPGWRRSLRIQQADDLPVPAAFKRAGIAALNAGGHRDRFYTEWLRRGAEDKPIFWGGAEAFTEAHKQRLASDRLRQRFAGRSSWDALEPIYQRFQNSAWETSHLHWMTYLDLNLRLPELLLMRVDKMSMGVGLEARVPFLDHRFVELALSIPSSIKTGGGTTKRVLKDSVRGLIPDDLIDRRKQGFGVPIYEWFYGRLGEMAREELTTFVGETDFLDRDEVLRLFDHGTQPQIWYLLNVALWWREYIA